jgi:hypothetical protein
MDSGMLDSLFVSLNIDQNLFGFSWKLTSREEKKFLRLDLTIFLTLDRDSLNLVFKETVGDVLSLRRTASFCRKAWMTLPFSQGGEFFPLIFREGTKSLTVVRKVSFHSS